MLTAFRQQCLGQRHAVLDPYSSRQGCSNNWQVLSPTIARIVHHQHSHHCPLFLLYCQTWRPASARRSKVYGLHPSFAEFLLFILRMRCIVPFVTGGVTTGWPHLYSIVHPQINFYLIDR
eukprot:6175929-Pleurochrysis_carterae.AAC.2